MTFAELVGFSFGVNEKVSPVRGFGKGEGSSSSSSSRSMMFGSCSSTQSKIPVTTTTTSCGLLDRKGKGNGGVTFSTFGGSCSGGVDEGCEKQQGAAAVALRNFDLNETGMLSATEIIREETIGEAHYSILAQKKKKNCKRPKLSAVGDPDWSPEQTSCIRSSAAKVKVKSVANGSKPIRCQNVKRPSSEEPEPEPERHECMIDSKPIIQSMPDNLKDLLSSSGWMVVFLEGSCHAIHVSPSGSVYGSLPKALEDYFRETSVFKEKQSVPSHLVSGSSPGVAKKPYKRKQVQKNTTAATEAMASPQQKSGQENNKESSILPVGVQSGPSHSVSGSSPAVAKRPYKRKQVQKSITTTTEPLASPQQKFGEENNKESSVLPVGVKSKAVQEVVPFRSEEGQEISCIQDKCLNNERKQLDFGSEVARVQSDNGDSDLQKCDNFVKVIEDDFLNHENNNANCSGLEETKSAQNNTVAHRNRKFRGNGRSGRVKGRNVPVVGKLDEGNVYFRYDSSNSVDMCTPDTHLNRQEASKKENENKGSSVPQKTRYREVHELMASSTVEEKANPCNSIEGLMPSITPPKQDTDERNDKESAPIPVELINVHQVLPSYMPDEKEKSCIKDDCLSKESKSFDWSNELVKNEQDKETNIHQIDELVDVRRSTRINGRHVPVESEMVGMWANDDFMELSISVANSVADENKDTTVCIEGEKFKGGASATATATTTTMDNILFKRTSTKKCGHRNTRNKRPLEKLLERIKNENTWENCDEIKISPVSQKCSLPSKKSLAMGLTKKQSPNASKRKSFGGGYSNGKRNRKRSGGCGLIVRRTGKGDHEETNSYETKVSMLSWLIDSGTLTENKRVVYKIKKGRRRLLKGWVTRGGIRCNCCKKVLSLLDFEVHAGSNIRQPWKITCLTSGKSLLQCQREAWEKEKKHRKIGFQTVGIGDADPTDDTCGICADGGQLICCDGCPSTFHQECVKLKSVPEGIWHCPFCRCAFCLLADCGQDESDGTVNLLSCSQCGCKYHRDCILENEIDKSSLNSSYCGKYCKQVAAGLSDILGVSNPLGGGFSWSLIRRLDEEGISSDQRQSSIMECNTKLPLALLVLHECFVPLLDPRSGLDMIVQAVFNCGSNFNRLNYEGFYTAILEKDESVISVATLRFHGTRLVEMPFIGTRPIYRRQGMCRRLLNAIEEMLSSLHVEKLIIPAIPDMLETWMKSFSFTHLELSHKNEIRNLNMIIFAETTLLQKSLCCERAKLAKDAKQLDLVDGLGKEINRSHHLLNCDGGHIQVILNCHSSEDGKQGHEVATPGQYEVIKAPISANAASVSLHSEVSNVSIQNVDTLSQNLERSPIPLTPVDIILAEVSVSPKKVSLPNSHGLMSAKC